MHADVKTKRQHNAQIKYKKKHAIRKYIFESKTNGYVQMVSFCVQFLFIKLISINHN